MIFTAEEYEQLRKCWDCEEINCPAYSQSVSAVASHLLNEGDEFVNEYVRQWIITLMTEPMPCRKEGQKDETK